MINNSKLKVESSKETNDNYLSKFISNLLPKEIFSKIIVQFRKAIWYNYKNTNYKSIHIEPDFKTPVESKIYEMDYEKIIELFPNLKYYDSIKFLDILIDKDKILFLLSKDSDNCSEKKLIWFINSYKEIEKINEEDIKQNNFNFNEFSFNKWVLKYSYNKIEDWKFIICLLDENFENIEKIDWDIIQYWFEYNQEKNSYWYYYIDQEGKTLYRDYNILEIFL